MEPGTAVGKLKKFIDYAQERINNGTSETKSSTTLSPKVQQLVDMGFSARDAKRALVGASDDVSAAALKLSELLVSGEEEEEDY